MCVVSKLRLLLPKLLSILRVSPLLFIVCFRLRIKTIFQVMSNLSATILSCNEYKR